MSERAVLVSDLKVGDFFQVPQIKGIMRAGLKGRVHSIADSQMWADFLRIEVLTRRSNIVIVVLPSDIDVLTWDAEPPPAKCSCTNHMGTRKVAYKSAEDAASAILKRHLAHGSHRIYPCPTQDGRFHITSKEERVHRPKG